MYGLAMMLSISRRTTIKNIDKICLNIRVFLPIHISYDIDLNEDKVIELIKVGPQPVGHRNLG